MPEQMRLFPEKDLIAAKDPTAEGELNALDEMFAATRHFRSGRQYMEMLDFITRFANYSPFNGFLLYTQNPEITCVATARTWSKRFNRRPAPHARPLIILAPMSPIRFVYDVDDTEGEPISADDLKTALQQGPFDEAVFNSTLHNCAVHGILVREIDLNRRSSESAMPLTDDIRHQYGELNPDTPLHGLILLDNRLSLEDRYAALVYELAGIFCGHRGCRRYGLVAGSTENRPKFKKNRSRNSRLSGMLP